MKADKFRELFTEKQRADLEERLRLEEAHRVVHAHAVLAGYEYEKLGVSAAKLISGIGDYVVVDVAEMAAALQD